jgi:hypothetical protein
MCKKMIIENIVSNAWLGFVVHELVYQIGGSLIVLLLVGNMVVRVGVVGPRVDVGNFASVLSQLVYI